MLAGHIFSAVVAGSASLAISLLFGHPPLISLLLYSLSGACGLLLFSLQAAMQADGSGA